VTSGRPSRQQKGCSNWNLQSGKSHLCRVIAHLHTWPCSEMSPCKTKGANVQKSDNCCVSPSEFMKAVRANWGLIAFTWREGKTDRQTHAHAEYYPCMLSPLDYILSPNNFF
jgi:hypothetical protein